VTDDANANLVTSISLEEVGRAIRALPKGKAPGHDDIPMEFFHECEHEIAPVLLQAFTAMLKEGKTSEYINKGIITLIPKSRDHARLNNWRPITLLGSIYKILAKLLAGRLQSVLPNIIRPNQTGFVEGRSILDNVFIAQESLGWAEESNQDLVLLLLDFEKAFDRIEWGFLFGALRRLGFGDTWIRWVKALYSEATSSVRINGEQGPAFNLARSVRQGCPLAPYLFILATDVLGHMLADHRNEIEGLSLPRGGHIRDQTFADDTALYLKGTPANLNKAQKVLETFSAASGAKVNWHKSAAIWASKKERAWNWGSEVGLKWMVEGEGIRYLGVLVGFHLPPEANFNRLMIAFKSKLIAWSHNLLSLAGRILVANQVLLASMWYLAACWNPNPRMVNQIRGVIRNFIWGGKDAPARAKVKWETLVLPTAQGGLGIIDPKAQSEALLAKLLIRGLAPGGEPWKEIIRNKVEQIKLPVHSSGPDNPDVNWIFAAPKLKRIQCSMWKSIVNAWMKVRPELVKATPTNTTEILRQPILSNPLVLNERGVPLGLSGLSEGNAFARAGHTRTRDLWSHRGREWKSLAELGMSNHVSNRKCKETIIANIPWTLSENPSPLRCGDWISDPAPRVGEPLEWIYFVLDATPNQAKVIEFKKTAPNGRIQASTNQAITIATDSFLQVRILSQESSKSGLRKAKELETPSKKTPIFWIFETGFIQDLP
jgi:hypothetical protein